MNRQEPVRIVYTGRYKFDFELAKLLAKGLGMPPEISSERDTGYCLTNGTCVTGMRATLERGEADMAIDMTVNSGLELNSINVSFPLDVIGLKFVSRRYLMAPGSSSMFRSFSLDVWFALIFSSLVMALALWTVSGKKRRFGEALGSIVCSLLGQSVRTKGTKLLMFPWILGVAFLINCFLSLLLSVLTVPRVRYVRDSQQLCEEVRSGRYTVSSRLKSALWALQESEETSWRVIAESIANSPLEVRTTPDYVQLSRNTSFAYVDFNVNLEYLGDNHHVSDDYFAVNFVGIPARKSFCCHEKLTTAIHRITSAGFYKKMQRDWMWHDQKLVSEPSTERSARPLAMSNVSGAFAILAIGHCAAALCLAVEILAMRCKDTSTPNNVQ